MIVRGTAFSSEPDRSVRSLVDHLFVIDDDGMISETVSPDDPRHAQLLADHQGDAQLVTLQPGQYLLPGFIDLHVHAPQWQQAGTALDVPLEQWLHAHTFPLEASFADLNHAGRVYRHLVGTLLSHGTTTALYFASCHTEASVELARSCVAAGQRGLVGRVVMDDPIANPDYYRDPDAASAISETERFIHEVRALGAGTPQGSYPVVTPRFIPSCTDAALAGLGELAQKFAAHVTTHCSESDWQHAFVAQRFGVSDATALDGFGLLTERTVLAHSVHLSDADAGLLRERGSAIAHCPISNAYFANAALPAARLLKLGVRLGLGTDLSGGFDPSVYSAIRQAVITSRMLNDGVNAALPSAERGVQDARITLADAFHAATAGGGAALRLPIGRLAPGFSFDAQLIDTRVDGASLPIFEDDPGPLSVWERICYLADPRHIRRVWVAGRVVHDSEVSPRTGSGRKQ